MVKIFTSTIEIQAKHSLMVIYSFITLFVVNSLIILLANAIFPKQIVLGAGTITPMWAIYFSVLELTLASMLGMLLVTVYEWKKNITFTPMLWMQLYLVINFVSLWVISRFATNIGLGISAWYVVLALAAALDWLQGMSMLLLGKYAKL